MEYQAQANGNRPEKTLLEILQLVQKKRKSTSNLVQTVLKTTVSSNKICIIRRREENKDRSCVELVQLEKNGRTLYILELEKWTGMRFRQFRKQYQGSERVTFLCKGHYFMMYSVYIMCRGYKRNHGVCIGNKQYSRLNALCLTPQY